jgi:hypothetical protein
MTDQVTVQASEEQIVYANILEKGMYIGLLLLVITFTIYVFGIMPPAVPLGEIAGYWSMNVDGYLAAINQNFLQLDHAPTGWAWLKLLGRGDFLNFIGIAILSGVTILCYLAIVPTLLRKGDIAYAVMALVEVAILGLAASGLLAVGAH